ncbi:MAG: CotH kinase family protein [Chitinispirillales bacterium]|jgi:hypothetical protein|nr:CotH kinase family protein [Chitinispirillales bacterium]
MIRNISLVISIITLAVLATCSRETKFGSGLPVVEIFTEDGAKIASKVNYINMTFSLTDPKNPKNDIVDKPGLIRGRGNNTWICWRARKKSYRIRLSEETPLLGLERATDWVLLAQHRDETLLYNAIPFELGRRFGFAFAHSVNFVDVYLNGEYQGNYLFTEQNQVGTGRVDIDRAEGWFAEIDQYFDSDPKFRTGSYDLPIAIKWPRPKNRRNIDNSAYDAVKSDLNALAAALACPNFPENGYRDLIDIDVLAAYLIINEIAANTDLSYPRSVFLYRDKDAPIRMGPLWDFDSGYGWHYRNWRESGFNDHFNFPDKRPPMHDFFKRFYEDPVFTAKLREKWNEMYDEIASMTEYIDEMAKKLERSADRNFEHWWYKTHAPFTDTRPAQPNDYRDAIKRLKNWYKARVFFLNRIFNEDEISPPDWQGAF